MVYTFLADDGVLSFIGEVRVRSRRVLLLCGSDIILFFVLSGDIFNY